MPSRIIDFDALSDPEGSVLLIDATKAPYVHKYQSVKKFLESPYQGVNGCQNPRIDGGRGRSIHAWPAGGLPLTENRALS